MQTYTHYKDSGIDWIGQIPEHWEIRRFKYLFNEINERSIDGNEDLLSVSQYTGVTKKSDKIDDGDLLTNASTLEGYKKVRKHQLVSNIMLAWNGSLAFSEYNGITSPAYCIYELKHDDVYKYFHYLFKTDLYKSEFKRNSSGVIESRLRLYTDDFFSIWSVLPPIQEQEAIANFLDDKTAKIDALVQTKQQQIEKLKELRQAKIHQAVTKGLDANAPTKDSGVEWIDEIPKHWEVKRLKNVALINKNVLPETFSKYNEIEYVDIGSVNLVNGIEKTENFLFKDAPSRARRIAKNNDTIISTVRTYLKAIDFIDNSKSDYIFSTGFAVLEPNRILPKFLANSVRSDYFTDQVTYNSKGMSYPAINSTDLSCLWLSIPPIKEQEAIVAYLDEVTGKIDQAIAQKQEQITKLKEYKQSLINDVVKGKVKVC